MWGDSALSVLVLTVRWVLINVLEFLCLCFFSLSARKRGIQLVFVFGFWSKNCCWCLQRWWFFFNGFAPVMIFFLMCFLNGFEWVCFGDDFFDRWPGFQIGGVGFWSMAWVVGVVAVVGSNWFDGLCVCGSVDGLCLCVCVCGFIDVLMVCVYVCVVLCV